MTDQHHRATTSLRWGIYGILIALSVGNMSGRILAVNSVDNARLESHRIRERLSPFRDRLEEQGVTGDELESRVAEREVELQEALRLQRPFLSSNDRSRWMTVRSLVEHGTYAIDEIVGQPTWDSIDMVKHKGRDGEEHLYSSKPPLLATLVAGEYWLVHKITGKTLGTHPYELGRFMVFTINVIPFTVMLILLAAIAERLGGTDYGRGFIVAAGALGTQLTAFAVVLNNHLPAAASASVALYALVRIWHDGVLTAERSATRATEWKWFAVAGLAAAFTAACELPALSFLGLVGLLLLVRWPRPTLIAFVPAVAVVAAAFFATNYIAHDSLRPPYAHRSETDPEDNWYEYTFTVNGRERQSYWLDPQGIDRGEPSEATYALHVLVGHHGIFSLTPVWLLSMLGAGIWLLRARNSKVDMRGDQTQLPPSDPPDSDAEHSETRISNPAFRWLDTRRMLAILTVVLTIVCLVFYILLRPKEDRNYGGMTGGFRWMFWFAPLWLLVALPAADLFSRRRIGRWACYLLLALSVTSAAYHTWNPWQHPWLTVFMEYMGWIEF
jgi:hypothetical protein